MITRKLLSARKDDGKMGRISVLADKLLRITIDIIEALLLKGTPVTAGIVHSIARGVILTNDRSLLVVNGGYSSRDMERRIVDCCMSIITNFATYCDEKCYKCD